MRLRRSAGALTAMERSYIKHMAKTGDGEYAAAKAGYAFPAVAAGKLARNEHVQVATRAEAQKYLREEAGGVSIAVLVSIGVDEKQPAGARVQAAKALAELSDIGLTGEQSRKDPGEMDGAELQDMIAKLERQRDALEAIAAGKAKDVTPSAGDVFG